MKRYLDLLDRYIGPETVPSFWHAYWNIKILSIIHFIVLVLPLMLFNWNEPLTTVGFCYFSAVMFATIAFVCFAFARRIGMGRAGGRA